MSARAVVLLHVVQMEGARAFGEGAGAVMLHTDGTPHHIFDRAVLQPRVVPQPQGPELPDPLVQRPVLLLLKHHTSAGHALPVVWTVAAQVFSVVDTALHVADFGAVSVMHLEDADSVTAASLHFL